MNTQYKDFLTKTMWLAIALFAGRCLLSWNEIITKPNLYTIFGYAGEVIGVTAVLMTLYEKCLWKHNPFEKTPVLKKRYKGTLKSSYDNISREAELEIKQTLLSVHVVFISGESRSKSISASIDEILGENQLTYCYLNTPKSEFRHRSEIHFGTALLRVDNPTSIIGQYYTDRKTIGDMEFTAVEE